MNKLSYCLIGDPHAINGVKNSGEVVLSGLWQWGLAFDKHGKKGDVRLLRRKEEIEEYDIIHINMTSGNLPLPQMIRDEIGDDSDTKLVVNVDFDVMQWGQNWVYPTLLTKAVDCADMIFHVESTGAEILEHVLNRKVHTLPHPVDVDGLDRYKKTVREPTIVTMWHRYIPDATLPFFAQNDVPLHRVLLGYAGNVSILPMYDFVYKQRDYISTIETMSTAALGCDLYPGRTFGRSVVEFAALAVPCVCSNTIEAARRCFPSLAVDPFDVAGAHKLFMDLIDDEDKISEVYKYAYDAAGYYSQKNCYERMIGAIEDISDSPKKQWQKIQNRYERRTDEGKSEKYLGIARKLASKFKTFVGVRGLVLDIGCGNGKYAGSTYKSMEHEYIDGENVVIGLDPLTSSEDRFPVVTAYGEEIPFQDNIFDAVVIVSMLDHVIGPKVILEEASRVMKDDGKMFIWSSIFRESAQPYHLHSFTEESLTELVSSMFGITRSEIYGDRQRYMFIECVHQENHYPTVAYRTVPCPSDEYSTDYWLKQTTVDSHKEFWNKCQYKEMQECQVIEIMQKHCSNVKTTLDAGAGTCRMCKPVRDAGYEYSAVDVSCGMLMECGDDVDTHVARLTDLPFEDEQFDLTMCLHVIRHNNPDDYKQIVDELCRVSSEYVLILNPFVKNRDDVKQLLYVSSDLPPHLAIFKKEVWDMPMLIEDLDAMMEENGFHRTLIEPVPGDYKKKDSFVVYGKHNV